MNKKLLILLFGIFSISISNAKEDTTIIEKIDINLNSTKSNGKGWDVFRNAPDIALCVVTKTDDHCYLRIGSKGGSGKIHNPLFAKRKYSLCQNSYNCRFELNQPLNNILGLVILDLDTKNNDFVDAAIIIDGTKEVAELADKIKTMDERLRNISYKYSQVFSEREKQRRLKKFTLCKISGSHSSKCKLKQSKIEIN